MNSLEKLILDLSDSKDIVLQVSIDLGASFYEDTATTVSKEQCSFVINAIQSAINRLEILNEELEQGE